MQDNALQLPREADMPAKDKYTTFNPRSEGYRKGVHKVPKFTRVSCCIYVSALRSCMADLRGWVECCS